MRIFVLIASTLLLVSCASTTRYAATSDSTARVRLVAQGVGNGYFAIPLELKCSAKLSNPLDDGDQLIAGIHGVPTYSPKIGSKRVIGMPGATDHPEWTFVELNMDASRDTYLRTAAVIQGHFLTPYEIGSCSFLTSITFEPNKDYEILFSFERKFCAVSFYELQSLNKEIVRREVKPTTGPKSCKS